MLTGGVELGLPPNIAYACLSETILLAITGRFESFTLGRELNIEKIKEIGNLAIENGFQLSEISSFGKMLTKEDIQEIKKRAQSKNWKQNGRISLKIFIGDL